jgi:hypothetical protein
MSCRLGDILSWHIAERRRRLRCSGVMRGTRFSVSFLRVPLLNLARTAPLIASPFSGAVLLFDCLAPKLD